MSQDVQSRLKRILLTVAIFSAIFTVSLKNLFSPVYISFDWLKVKSKKFHSVQFKKDLHLNMQTCPCELVRAGRNIVDGDYTHRMVIVKSTPFWYGRYSQERIVTCGGYAVLVSYSRGDLCTICSADYVVFNAPLKTWEWLQLHQLRTNDQVWVHTTEESPINSRKLVPDKRLVDVITLNVTQTWHPNADIYLPYGEFVPYPPGVSKKLSTNSNFESKNKLVLWISSHCYTQMWHRYNFVYDFAKHIPVDMYGDCGNLTCLIGDPTCRDIFRQYKFLLALENSCCGGYITEKFWNSLTKIEAIPIVVGAPKEDYERLAPVGSFIHADDFPSMEDLADYIFKVAKNKGLYSSYFKWREHGDIVSHKPHEMLSISNEGICSLLDFTHSSSFLLKTSSFHPYGPNWMGGCFSCGEHTWIQRYVHKNVTERLKTLH